jgi:hypothetical protein
MNIKGKKLGTYKNFELLRYKNSKGILQFFPNFLDISIRITKKVLC